MTLSEVKQLHNGDLVYWTDPDEGTCSRVYKIAHIEVSGNIVRITDVDGNDLECFADELT